jgi:hypothetical protein
VEEQLDVQKDKKQDYGKQKNQDFCAMNVHGGIAIITWKITANSSKINQ